MKRIILAIGLLFFTITSLYAQANLKIELVSFPDTVIEYMPNTASIKIKNVSLDPYNGPLVIYMAELIGFFPTDIHNEVLVNIPATDSIIFNIGNIIFFNPFFKYGNNIVVVWPQGIGCDNDSLQVNVFMKNFTGIPIGLSGKNQVSVTPNPFADKFTLHIPEFYFTQNDIILRDALGRDIPITLSGNEVHVPENSAGLLLLEVRMPDGNKIMKKLMRH